MKCLDYSCSKTKMVEMVKIYKCSMHHFLTYSNLVLFHATLLWFSKFTHNFPMINKYVPSWYLGTFEILVSSITKDKFRWFDTLVHPNYTLKEKQLRFTCLGKHSNKLNWTEPKQSKLMHNRRYKVSIMITKVMSIMMQGVKYEQ